MIIQNTTHPHKKLLKIFKKVSARHLWATNVQLSKNRWPFIVHLYSWTLAVSLTASSLGTKSRCPIPRRPITLQNESGEAWLLWARSSVFPSPSSTALCTVGRGRCGVRAGTGEGEGGGDGGGVGQGEGEGWSRSGARVADDSSVSFERPSKFPSCWKRGGQCVGRQHK